MIFLYEQTPYFNNLQAIILEDIALEDTWVGLLLWFWCVMAPVAAHTKYSLFMVLTRW